MTNDHTLGEPVHEATNPQGLPVFPDPSAPPLFDEANSQHVRETVHSHDTNFEDGSSRSEASMKNCEVCGYEEEELGIMTAPCGHTYCGECVNKLFDRAAEDESNFPPRCCGETITLEDTKWFLSPVIYNKFHERFEEFSAKKRTYCSDPECATFISLKSTVGEKAKCSACQKLTCIICKAEAHEGDCPQDPAVQSFMTAAKEAGFQQCRECKR